MNKKTNTFLLLMTLKFIFAFCFLPLFSYTQPFQYLYGGQGLDYGHDIVQTTDGGYVIIGSTESFGFDKDVFLLKVDSLGNIQWSKTYNAGVLETGVAIIQTNDDGFLIGGNYETKEGLFDGHFFILKTDKNGNTEWARKQNETSDVATINPCKDGGYILSGTVKYTIDTTNYYDGNIFLIKLDSLGNREWGKSYGDSTYNWAEGNNSVIQSSDNGFIVVGTTVSPFNSNQTAMLVIKTDSLGDTLWTKVVARSDGGATYGIGILKTLDNNYIAAGALADSQTGGSLFVKLTGTGDTIWTKCYFEISAGYHIYNLQDSSYLSFGLTDGIELLNFNDQSEVLLARKIGTEKYEDPIGYSSGINTINNTFILTGDKLNFRYKRSIDVYFAKMDIEVDMKCNNLPVEANLLNINLKITSGVPVTDINNSTNFNFSTSIPSPHRLNACDSVDSVNELPIREKQFIANYNIEKGTIQIESPYAVTKEISLVLYNAIGQLVKQKQLHILTTHNWNIIELPQGIYFLRITSKNIDFKEKIMKL